MKGQHHIRISLFTGLVLLAPWILQDTILILTALVGIFIGSLLPDSDASDRTAKHSDSVIYVFDWINAIIIYPILLKLFHEEKRHRGILHTIGGVFVYSIILTTVTGIVLIYFSLNFNILVFGMGLFAGSIMHLIEDSCTRMGTNPFYPKNKWLKYSGTIVTFNKQDKRPEYFSEFLMYLFVILILTQIYFAIPQLTMAGLNAVIVIVSWMGFMAISGVKKIRV